MPLPLTTRGREGTGPHPHPRAGGQDPGSRCNGLPSSAQDEMEIGYIQAPHKTMPVVFDSPRNRGLKDFPIKCMLVCAEGWGVGRTALKPPLEASFLIACLPSPPPLLLSVPQVCVLPKQPSRRRPGHFCFARRSGSAFPKALSSHELTSSSR